jgi:hypothetical protein
MPPRDDDTDPLYALFGPSLRRERKLQCLTLYDPWTRMYHLYRIGLAEPDADSHPRAGRRARRPAHRAIV